MRKYIEFDEVKVFGKKGYIIAINNNSYDIKFDDGTIKTIVESEIELNAGLDIQKKIIDDYYL